MTIDVSTSELVIASAFLGGQIITLAGVVRSNISQGRRLGSLERWRTAVKAVQRADRQRRADTRGIPIINSHDTDDEDDETPQ